MPIVPTGHEMATIRRDASRLLRDEVQVWRPSYTADGKGGLTRTLAIVSSGPGELAPMGSSDVEYFAGKIGDIAGWIVTVPQDRDVRPDDQLRVAGVTLEVIGTDRGRTGGWVQRIPAREIA